LALAAGLACIAVLAADAAAMYHPAVGRFMQRDPIGRGDSLYAYAGDTPIALVDPSGLAHVRPGVLEELPCWDPRVEIRKTVERKIQKGAYWMVCGEEEACFCRVKPVSVRTYPIGGDTGNYSEKAWRRRFQGQENSFGVHDVDDFKAKLGAASDAMKCKCASMLHVYGHGNSAQQDVGPMNPAAGWSGDSWTASKAVAMIPGSVGDGRNALNLDIFDNVKFCTPCTIVLHGCRVAFERQGQAFINFIAGRTGCTVIGTTGYTRGPDDSTEDGVWVQSTGDGGVAPLSAEEAGRYGLTYQ
jgi:hypothetical protein